MKFMLQKRARILIIRFRPPGNSMPSAVSAYRFGHYELRPRARTLQERDQGKAASAAVPSAGATVGAARRRGYARSAETDAVGIGNLCRFRTGAKHRGQRTSRVPLRLRRIAALR